MAKQISFVDIKKNLRDNTMSKTVVEWFDPYNKEHLKAYLHLKNEGCWPRNFLPKDIVIPLGWGYMLESKLAKEWINSQLSK